MIRKRILGYAGAWHAPVFLAALIVAAALLNLAAGLMANAPGWLVLAQTRIALFSTVFLSILIEALPFLLLGVFGSGAIAVLIRRTDRESCLPRFAPAAVLAGALLGMVLPGGETGVVPLARRLIEKGLPTRAAVAFLLAGPVLNPITIAGMLATFGVGTIFWARLVVSLVVAVAAGLLFPWGAGGAGWLVPQIPVPEPAEVDDTSAPSTKLRSATTIALDEFFEIGRLLIAGAVLAGLAAALLPLSALLSAGQSSTAALVGYSFLRSFGSLADASAAAGWLENIPAASIVTMLVSGAMIDLKNALLYRAIFSWRAVALLGVVVLLLNGAAAFLLHSVLAP